MGKNKKIIALALVLILTISIIGFTLSRTSFGSNDDKLNAVANADKEIIRLGDSINFSSDKSSGDFDTCLWEFGEGNNSIERNPSFQYSQAGWYNVTLIIVDNNQNRDNSTIKIGVQQNDNALSRDYGLQRDLRPLWYTGISPEITVGPNIAHPATNIQVEINQLIGQITIIIFCYWEYAPSTWQGIRIHEEDITSYGNTVTFDYLVNPEELNKEMQIFHSKIEVDIQLYTGQWNSVQVNMETTFQMDNL